MEGLNELYNLNASLSFVVVLGWKSISLRYDMLLDWLVGWLAIVAAVHGFE